MKSSDMQSDIQKEKKLLESLAESLNQFTGSLTGKNLEEKLIEYSEVYGEILLNLYNTTEELKKENKLLKKQILKLENQLQEFSSNSRNEYIIKKSKQLLIGITFLNFLLFIINLTFLLWK